MSWARAPEVSDACLKSASGSSLSGEIEPQIDCAEPSCDEKASPGLPVESKSTPPVQEAVSDVPAEPEEEAAPDSQAPQSDHINYHK